MAIALVLGGIENYLDSKSNHDLLCTHMVDDERVVSFLSPHF